MDRGSYADKWIEAFSWTNGEGQFHRQMDRSSIAALSIYFCIIPPLCPYLSALHYPPPPFLKNKAGYTATEVACGWAGAIFEVTRPFRQQQWSPKIKIIKKVKCDRQTDRPTDKAECSFACTRLKTRVEFQKWDSKSWSQTPTPRV